jgi:hypothetical protein
VQTPQPKSAKTLEKVLRSDRGGALTVADAAARGGIPLRDADEGLRWLAAEFGGHLAATEKGEILYSFPGGLERAPETRLWRRVGRGIVKAVAGVGRFIVRAWVSVVLVGYALAFLALLIALSARSDRDDGPGEAIGIVLRIIAEALYWTFHPFSPVYLRHEPGWMHGRMYGRRRSAPKLPFYERVNRFVFGPPAPERNQQEEEKKVIAELRRNKGRVAPSDVMRVTGLAREDAERLLLRLVVDYQGDIEVADSGAIVYKFTEIRQTARDDERLPPPSPAWNQAAMMRPLTGNTAGSNMLFALVNGFNLIASSYVLANDLTIERIVHLLTQMNERNPIPMPPADGMPLVFGAIPFAFSLALFILPLVRALRRPSEARRVARENGWKGVLRHVLTGRRGRVELGRDELARAWVAAGGKQPSDNELRDAVRSLGGDVDLNEAGQLVYKFEEVEAELQATEEGRRMASEDEARPGEVVFDSAEEGVRFRDEAPVRSPSDVRQTVRPRPAERGEAPPALEEIPTRIPDASTREETAEEVLARLGVDTRRRGR